MPLRQGGSFSHGRRGFMDHVLNPPLDRSTPRLALICSLPKRNATYTTMSCCSLGVCMSGFCLLPELGPDSKGHPLLLSCHNAQPTPSEVTDIRNSNGSLAWETRGASVCFPGVSTFSRRRAALVPSFTNALSLPGGTRAEVLWQEGSKSPAEPPNLAHACTFFCTLRGWIGFNRISHSFWDNTCLT